MAVFDPKYILKIFTAVNFCQFLIIKTLYSELDPDPQLRKILDPDPHKINENPEPCMESHRYR
jgi:hypothetical protein